MRSQFPCVTGVEWCVSSPPPRPPGPASRERTPQKIVGVQRQIMDLTIERTQEGKHQVMQCYFKVGEKVFFNAWWNTRLHENPSSTHFRVIASRCTTWVGHPSLATEECMSFSTTHCSYQPTNMCCTMSVRCLGTQAAHLAGIR